MFRKVLFCDLVRQQTFRTVVLISSSDSLCNVLPVSTLFGGVPFAEYVASYLTDFSAVVACIFRECDVIDSSLVVESQDTGAVRLGCRCKSYNLPRTTCAFFSFLT